MINELIGTDITHCNAWRCRWIYSKVFSIALYRLYCFCEMETSKGLPTFKCINHCGQKGCCGEIENAYESMTDKQITLSVNKREL